eukprot:924571-Prorocentrum_minimum.AAC.4
MNDERGRKTHRTQLGTVLVAVMMSICTVMEQRRDYVAGKAAVWRWDNFDEVEFVPSVIEIERWKPLRLRESDLCVLGLTRGCCEKRGTW